MAIQSMVLDPAAAVYTDNDIVGKINSAGDNITRAGSVDAAARPIGTGEVGSTELAGGAVGSAELATGVAAANLDSMSDTSRGYVKTSPVSGEFPVIAIQRDAAGKERVEYDDVPIV